MAARKPTGVTVRAYQVGFGDCLLVTFHYGAKASDARHVLIDFGSTGKPKSGGHTPLEIARSIEQECGGRLHAVIATHRHRDHISGFGGKSGSVIAGLKPAVVLQPWTEDPKAAPNAKTASNALKGVRAFTASLDEMHRVAEFAVTAAAKYSTRSALGRQLAFLGEENLKNLAAIKGLQKLPGKHVYAAFGEAAGLAKALPGVKVQVLGPPTLKQSQDIATQRSKDPDEFWHLQALAAGRAASTAALFHSRYRHRGTNPTEVRWLLPRLDKLSGEQLLEIVRILDDALNNTSLVLLFEVGSRKLLFPGDAQIENWSYSLKTASDKAAIRKNLAAVDLYKVGHHGSLNATPKSLWQLFKKKGPTGKKGRLVTVLSTMAGKHGSVDRSTEVPRRTLLTELGSMSKLVNTQTVTKKADFFTSVDIDV
jgi:hypothetical protein